MSTLLLAFYFSTDARFLLARLYLEMLSEQRTQNAVRVALTNLPTGLDNTYKEVMERIYKQGTADVDLALKVLGWITYAKVPLEAKALQHAVAIQPGMMTLEDGDLTDEDDLISVCAGIVTIDRESGIVRLVHYTTQEYLEIHLKEQKVEVVRGCLTYLGLDAFREPCDSWPQWGRLKPLPVVGRLKKYPFVGYAVRYWPDHIRGELEEELKDVALYTFKERGLRYSVWQIEEGLGTRMGWGPGGDRSLLHIFAAYGLSILCRNLLDKVGGHHMYLHRILAKLMHTDSMKICGVR